MNSIIKEILKAILYLALGFVGVARAAPPTPEPADNKFSQARARIGQQLFFDPRCSADNTLSCATCHVPDRGWTDNKNIATGIRGQAGTRNTPTILNSGRQQFQFHDGGAFLLEGQASKPFVNPVEMGHRSLADLQAKINQVPGYVAEFRETFKTNGVTTAGIMAALSAFERTVTVDDAPYQRYLAGETWALDSQEKRGMAAFNRVGCAACHPGTDLRDQKFHNTGVVTRFGKNDQGLFGVTGKEEQRRAFKTPTLIQLAETAPYFHDGTALTIADVIQHYNRGGANDLGQADALIDRRVAAIRGQLSLQDQMDLEAFLSRGTLSPNPPKISAPPLPQ